MYRCASLFFCSDTATTEIYTLSLHDALPILYRDKRFRVRKLEDLSREIDWAARVEPGVRKVFLADGDALIAKARDRKSTRLNSSHSSISYAVFCLKKKKKQFHWNSKIQLHIH